MPHRAASLLLGLGGTVGLGLLALRGARFRRRLSTGQCSPLVGCRSQDLFKDALGGDEHQVDPKGGLQHRIHGVLELVEVPVQVGFGCARLLFPDVNPGLRNLAVGGGGYLHHFFVFKKNFLTGFFEGVSKPTVVSTFKQSEVSAFDN